MTLWKRKLAAWLHDPAEKALVLMRDTDESGRRIGHEDGSIAVLRDALGIRKADFDKRADYLAAGADRPNWPEEKNGIRPAWANVRFAEKPVLIHPLAGEDIRLAKLDDIQAAHVRNASLDHFLELIEKSADGTPDYMLTHLAFWRFGPEPKLAAPEIGELWRLLPADTRTPDHSIWAHLDVVSALAGAMAEGDEPAPLMMSFGPVQGFIAQARSTSDLWAGSHLLSSLVWEGLKIVCERLGPDAVIFPSMRGVAAVDRWLLQTARAAGKNDAWLKRFEAIDADWLKSATDANPLFAATLPNKFMALVPKRRASALAEEVTKAVRFATQTWATQAAERVFGAIARSGEDVGAHWHTQIAEQLRGFPEVHWSATPWSLLNSEDGFPETGVLEAALAAFYPPSDGPCGFFADPLWTLLSEGKVEERQGRKRKFRKLVLSEGELEFFVPNHGLLYPAVHELSERNLAAAKALRTFDALPQRGYRCTLTGEHEWLTETLEYTKQNPAKDPETVLHLPPQARETVPMASGRGTAWSRVAGTLGIKEGEHLGALATLKRLWPTLFVEQVQEFLDKQHVSRFIVSTHTMALATSLEPLAARLAEPEARSAIEKLLVDDDRAPVLPRSLYFALRTMPGGALAARIPAALDRLHNSAGRTDMERREDEVKLQALEREIEDLLGHKPESYYALILMDGDRMGAWIAGNEPAYQRKYKDTWHPTVRASVAQKFGLQPEIVTYMDAYRPPSPARHAAISKVLNDFSTHVARHVVEDIFKGKLLYSGGDDVLAMVSVDDLLPAMLILRAAYSGVGDMAGLPANIDLKGLSFGKGFVQIGKGANKRLMLMMGTQATASIGAVVAHHQAPLAAVLRDLHAAEKRAKDYGRNAFCLRVIKRGGGEVAVTAPFWTTPVKAQPQPNLAATPAGFMLRLADALNTEFSRRAIFRAQEWLAGLPPRPSNNDSDWQLMVASYLAYQFEQQKGVQALAHEAVRLAVSIADRIGATGRDQATANCHEHQAGKILGDLIVTAEFFAREGRTFGNRTAS